jgi:PAS domain S-box-containing protein
MLWNRKAEEITGYKAADVVGKRCHDDILVHTDKDQHQLCTTESCPLCRSISLGKESEEPVLVYAKQANGSRVALSVSTAPLRDASGKIIGGIETFRDESPQIRDMELARRIQQRLFPKAPPQIPNFQFDVRYYPHELVGGDFYDIRTLGPNLYAFMLADVRGHGVSAALYTMWLKSLEESLISHAAHPDRFMQAMGREFKKLVVKESFATVFYGVLNVKRSQISYTSAGHPSPLHFHADKSEVTPLEGHGVPLSILVEGNYETATRRLEPGDLLLCFTDGLTEAIDKRGQRLREKGLAELLKKEVPRTDDNLLERLYHHIKQECGNVSLSDDVLLLSIKRLK